MRRRCCRRGAPGAARWLHPSCRRARSPTRSRPSRRKRHRRSGSTPSVARSAAPRRFPRRASRPDRSRLEERADSRRRSPRRSASRLHRSRQRKRGPPRGSRATVPSRPRSSPRGSRSRRIPLGLRGRLPTGPPHCGPLQTGGRHPRPVPLRPPTSPIPSPGRRLPSLPPMGKDRRPAGRGETASGTKQREPITEPARSPRDHRARGRRPSGERTPSGSW